MLEHEIQVHMSHCNQGDYINSCKYGLDEQCPALQKKAEELKQKEEEESGLIKLKDALSIAGGYCSDLGQVHNMQYHLKHLKKYPEVE